MTRKARGWKKAMRNVTTHLVAEARCRDCHDTGAIYADFNVPMYTVVVSGLDESHGGWAAGVGWTYDREGNWTCQECNQKGGEE